MALFQYKSVYGQEMNSDKGLFDFEKDKFH